MISLTIIDLFLFSSLSLSLSSPKVTDLVCLAGSGPFSRPLFLFSSLLPFVLPLVSTFSYDRFSICTLVLDLRRVNRKTLTSCMTTVALSKVLRYFLTSS